MQRAALLCINTVGIRTTRITICFDDEKKKKKKKKKKKNMILVLHEPCTCLMPFARRPTKHRVLSLVQVIHVRTLQKKN
jgi:hypothetical protein